jgi:hypothetical protein
MEIKSFSPGEQVDIAVDLGVVPPPLPEINMFTYSQPVRVPGLGATENCSGWSA